MAKLYFNGLELELIDEKTSSDFFRKLAKTPHQTLNLKSKEFITCNRFLNGIAEGVVFIDTDENSFLSVNFEGGRIVTKVTDNPDNANRHNFIFYRINTAKGRGVFTQYQGSGGLGTLRYVLGHLYRKYVAEERMRKQLEARKSGKSQMPDSEGSTSRNEKPRVDDLQPRKLHLVALAPNHDFASRLAEMTALSHFEYSVPHAKYAEDGALQDEVETTKIVYTIKETRRTFRTVRQAVSRILTRVGILSGAVVGKDSDGKSVRIPIDPSHLAFDSMDRKTAMVQDNFDAETQYNGPLIGRLRRIMNENQELFG